jgi:anti-anti-sigma factor
MAPTSPRYGLPGTPEAAEGLLVEIETREAPTRQRLRVTGELDLATVGLLRSAIARAAADRQYIELDLAGVTFCDVVGATAIEQAQQQLQTHGRQLALRGIDRPLHLLLAVDGLFGTLQQSTRTDGDSHREPPDRGTHVLSDHGRVTAVPSSSARDDRSP